MSIDAVSETIGTRLARVASRFPERIALVEGSSTLSFRELDEAATRIAQMILTAQSGGSSRHVCLLFQSRLLALKAIFGAARSGYAYVPLDAGDPEERLRSIIVDSEAAVLLTEHGLLHRASAVASTGGAVIDIAHMPSANVAPLPDVSPDVPMNIYYTSGSTGRPKGAIQTHRNLLFFADTYARALAIRADDRLSLLYTLSFNAAKVDIFGGLFNGATLCAYDLRRHGISQLADWLDRERITVLHTVPTVFRELGKRLSTGRVLAHLRVIDLGGEAVFASDVDIYREHTEKRCVFINQLASTEVGLIAQHKIEHGGPRPSAKIIPVGRCPDGVQVAIRRPDGSPAHTEELGEIVVSSVHVTPGYWRRPELNAVGFGTDANEPGTRQYFTGDLGRIDGQGVLHFLGREGSRVKIRGHTVDLAEVEAGLAACPGVIKGAVLPVGGNESTEPEQLVAYLVLARDAESDSAGIRRALARLLPSYMLPTRYVFLSDLPNTVGGKVDRRALPEPPECRATRERPFVPPRSPTEHQLAALWEEIFGVTRVGATDDFFDLGGDSLHASALVTAIEAAFGRVINPSLLLKAPKLAELARALAGVDQLDEPITVLRQSGTGTPIFFLHNDEGHGLYTYALARSLDENRPFYAVHRHSMHRDRDAVTTPTIEVLAANGIQALRAARPKGPYVIGGHCNGGMIALEMARQLRDAGERIELVLMVDTRAPESAARLRRRLTGALGPLLRPIRNGVQQQATLAVRTYQEAAWRARYYSNRAAALKGAGLRAQVDFVHRKLTSSGRTEQVQGARSSRRSSAHTQALDSRQAETLAVKRYLPPRYQGSVALFRAEAFPAREPDLGWSALLPRLDVIIVPGDHHTCITRHVAVFAKRLDEVLRGAESDR